MSTVTSDKFVWFYDGMTTGRQCMDKGKLDVFSDSHLKERDGKKAALPVYVGK